MRGLSLLLAVGALLCLPRPPAAELLDERFADYLEDEQTNRVLAGIHVRLRRTGSKTRVWVTASAESPNVDPVPGYRGLRGANHITSRELEKTLAAGQLKILTRCSGSNTKHFGTCFPGRWGRIPERHVDPNGRLLLHAWSEREHLLEVHGRGVPLSDGEHETFLEVKGVPRLRIRTRLLGRTGRIVSVDSLGGHDLRQ